MKIRIYKKKYRRMPTEVVYVMTHKGSKYDELHSGCWPYKELDIPRSVVQAIADCKTKDLCNFYKALYKGLKKNASTKTKKE